MTLAVDDPGSTKVNQGWPNITHPKKRAVLAAYLECGGVKKACATVGINFVTHYDWMHYDPQYAEAFAKAQDMLGDYLEQVAIERATQGVERAVYYQGEIVGYETEHSDTLLKFLLRGAKPQKYSERIDMNVNQKSLSIVIGDLPAAPAPELVNGAFMPADGAMIALGSDANADSGTEGDGTGRDG